MKLMTVAGVLALALGLGSLPGAAQTNLTTAEVQRLQDRIYDASGEIAQVRDSSLAFQLQTDLDAAREEAIYLKVKLRKNEPIRRSEYTDLQDRVENIRSRARAGESRSHTSFPNEVGSTRQPGPAGSSVEVPERSGEDEVPPGTEFDVRLITSLNSGTTQVEDHVEATTIVDLRQDGRVLVPAGSVMRGVVNSVQKAGRLERKGSITLIFNEMRIKGRRYPIHGTIPQALESEGIRGEVGRIGAGAGVGAIIGGILGGLKGALAGILIGGGGTIAATEGTDVDLKPGTVLRVRLDSGLNL